MRFIHFYTKNAKKNLFDRIRGACVGGCTDAAINCKNGADCDVKCSGAGGACNGATVDGPNKSSNISISIVTLNTTLTLTVTLTLTLTLA